MVSNSEEIIAQIKMSCSSVTENTYDAVIEQSCVLLSKLCDLGLEKESVYQLLLQYYDSLEDSRSRDCVADILDFIIGWCSPQKSIWKKQV